MEYFAKIVNGFTLLTHYSPVLLIYTPWKHQKTYPFEMFDSVLNPSKEMKLINISWLSNFLP